MAYKVKDKMTNNDRQNTTQKTKNRAIRTTHLDEEQKIWTIR